MYWRRREVEPRRTPHHRQLGRKTIGQDRQNRSKSGSRYVTGTQNAAPFASAFHPPFTPANRALNDPLDCCRLDLAEALAHFEPPASF
jgi:hypothetical protein